MTGDKAAPGYWLSFAAACGLVATLALYRRGGAAERSASLA
jgi:MHS family citrate/tricarballylate:H+ symporter-like MFS transporter